jgi:predicted transcriptional regulator
VRLDKGLRLALASRCEKEERPASFIIRRAIKRELEIARQSV